MIKLPVKRYLIIISLLCFILGSTLSFGSNTSASSVTLNESYNSLTNIQKQLRSISRNTFINTVNNASNDDNLKQLSAFSNQLVQLNNELTQLSTSNLSTDDIERLQTLLTVSTYLNYIQGKIAAFSTSQDPSEQYDILNSIFIANELVNRILSYTAPS